MKIEMTPAEWKELVQILCRPQLYRETVLLSESHLNHPEIFSPTIINKLMKAIQEQTK